MPVELGNSRLGAWSIDADLSELDIKKYSAFKHGRSSVAVEYASDIFCRVLRERLVKGISYTVLLSPSSYLPTASHGIAIALYQLMRKEGYRVRLAKIRRNCTYSVDYGMLNAEERMALIQGDQFSLDERFEVEEQLLFVDDVSISGAHQFVLENILTKYRVQNKAYFLYYAVANDASLDSSIEGVMNNALVRDVRDLSQLMIEPDFVLNTRVTKLILNSDQLEEEWLNEIPLSTLREIAVGAKGNDYHEMAEYVENFHIIERSLRRRESVLN
jgi:hypothetical protein